MNNRLLFGVIPIYGLLIGAAYVLGIFLSEKREKEMVFPKDTAFDLCLWILPAALIGARLYYVAFQWDYYKDDLWSILKIWNGGLAIYGGIIGGVIVGLIFARARKIQFWSLADMLAPALILGQAIGRWGNFFNGEAYGYLVENPALHFFPVAVFVNQEWHMATFFYESFLNFCGFLLLWSVRNKTRKPGSLFFLYLVWYGVSRFFVEGLRTDSLMWGSLRVSQVLSLVLVIAAGAVLIVRAVKQKGEKP